MPRKGLNTSVFGRHSRECGNPAPLVLKELKALDPRSASRAAVEGRGDDGRCSGLPRLARVQRLPRKRLVVFEHALVRQPVRAGDAVQLLVQPDDIALGQVLTQGERRIAQRCDLAQLGVLPALDAGEFGFQISQCRRIGGLVVRMRGRRSNGDGAW